MRASLLATVTVLPTLLAGCTEDAPPAPSFQCSAPGYLSGAVHVNITTNKGSFMVELYGDKAPVTVCNFLTYVGEKFYDDTCFHRVIPGFVVQGGGFDKDSCDPRTGGKTTHDDIVLETQAKLKNLKATLAMARTNAPNSATSQFFVNTVDNCFLDPPSFSSCPDRSVSPDGYAVFGKVIEGFAVVEALEAKGTQGGTPTEVVYITTARPVTH